MNLELVFENGVILRDSVTGLQVASLDSTTFMQGTPLPAAKVGPLLAAAPAMLWALENMVHNKLSASACRLVARELINQAKGL